MAFFHVFFEKSNKTEILGFKAVRLFIFPPSSLIQCNP